MKKKQKDKKTNLFPKGRNRSDEKVRSLNAKDLGVQPDEVVSAKQRADADIGKKQEPASDEVVSAARYVQTHDSVAEHEPKFDLTRLQWPEKPEKYETNISNYLIWKTKCDRFRVYRSQSTLIGGDTHFQAEKKVVRMKNTWGHPITPPSVIWQPIKWQTGHGSKSVSGRGVDYHTLEDAINAVVEYATENIKTVKDSDHEDALVYAKKNKVADCGVLFESSTPGLGNGRATLSSMTPERMGKKRVLQEGVTKFGHRMGTRAARIDMALTDEWKTHAQILKDANYDKPVHGHLNGLVKDGWVLKNDKGQFKLNPAKN